MQVPVPIRRQGYRVAHRLLRAWWFVARPRVRGVKCALTDGDRVLLVRHTYGNQEWDLPGGGIRRGEPPLVAARREMEEELGVRLDHMHPLGEISLRAYRAHDRIHCFQAEIGPAELAIDEGELAAASWFARDSLPTDVGRYVFAVLDRL
jgi:8-oxo-dGTP pyrophosphatase MutT (NUDIX family)